MNTKKKEIQKKKVTDRVPIFRIKRNITISLCTNLFEKNEWLNFKETEMTCLLLTETNDFHTDKKGIIELTLVCVISYQWW